MRKKNYNSPANCLIYIVGFMRTNGYMPTLREISVLFSNPCPAHSTVLRWNRDLELAKLLTLNPKIPRGTVLTTKGWIVSGWEIERIVDYLQTGEFESSTLLLPVNELTIIQKDAERKVLEIRNLISELPPTIIIDEECLPAFNYGFHTFKDKILLILNQD